MWHTGTYMVHVPLHVSGPILHGAFQTKFLGILYHKLSTFMVIRKGTGSFKCHFRIFGILGNYFIMVWVPLWHVWWGLSPSFLCYQLWFLWDFFTEERSYQGLKDATLFGLLSDKSTEKLEEENSNFRQILHTGHFQPSVHMQISQVTSLPVGKSCVSQVASMENFQSFEYLDLNYSALLAD